MAEVLATSEFRRIRDGERRVWQDDPQLPAVVEHVRALLCRNPEPCAGAAWEPRAGGEICTACGSPRYPKPVQAVVLRELYERRGVLGPIRTGGGKTFVSLAAAEILDARRPLLLVPASLRDKTIRAAHALSAHWRIRPIKILSYETLSRADNEHALEQYAPDLVVMDEAHGAKNGRGARARRIGRYLKARTKAGEHVPVLSMSGSYTSRTLHDYWHQLGWTHAAPQSAGSPLPKERTELQQWAWALDEKVSDGARWQPGALLELSPPAEDDGHGIRAARLRYGRRLMSTPGVVGSGGDMPACGLVCTIERHAPSPAVAAAVDRMRATWETPCGLPFETALDLWRHERTLACGLYYRWKVQPPREWIDARKAWSATCRHILSNSRRLDTPMAVANAIARGDVDDGGTFAAWAAVRELFNPDHHREAVWLCDAALRRAAEWLEREQGIAWVHHGAFGRRLSDETGVPFFAELGRSPAGVAIDMHAGPAIASLHSCRTGFDLQGTPATKAKHFRNYIVTSPTKNLPLEQLLSRTHRDGQEEDDVFATFPQTLDGDVQALSQARADAIYVEATTLAPQRLGAATWIE